MILSLLLAAAPLSVDTLKSLDIEEVVVVATPKETERLRRLPVSTSIFDGETLKRRQIKSICDLSSYAPGFYMPDYGSRLTSACYIRGIGSRINTPAVGLYVDNVPYLDKSAYDFQFLGIDRVDILRGPQGTLYGRNTMGGLVRVYTADPLSHHGTELSLGYTGHTQGRRAAFTTYLHPANKMGLSIGGYYDGASGHFTNSYTGKKQDGHESAGGRLRWSWQASERVKLDWTASYEYVDQDANPYYYIGDKNSPAVNGRGILAQNRPSSYRRHLFNSGIGVEHRLEKTVLSSITAYQTFSDRLFLDQDFTAADIYSLCQEQHHHSVSEEISLRSKHADGRWQWTTGLFGMYQSLKTTCPVTFYSDGLAALNGMFASVLPEQPTMSLTLTGETLPFTSNLSTPSANIALFHQSTLRLVGGLSATIGLRLDYDHHRLDLHSGGLAPYTFRLSMGPQMSFDKALTADAGMSGKLRDNGWQFLPKASLQYSLTDGKGNVYLSVAKGYRSGGYNIQAYSDLSQTSLQRAMMTGTKAYSIETINSLPMSNEEKEKIIADIEKKMDPVTPDVPNFETLAYKPEYTWSYELGTHLNLLDNLLQLDLAAYYMKTRDQQLARFTQSGMGRVTVNSGRSRSTGLEATIKALLFEKRLTLVGGYSLTHATFTSYDLGENKQGENIDYSGNRVPFVPRHNFNLSGDYRHPLKNKIIRAVNLGADLRGAGEVFWDEANSRRQPFYVNLAVRAGVVLSHDVRLEIWARNLSNSRYTTFSFESMGRRYAQYCTPRHLGVDVSWKF